MSFRSLHIPGDPFVMPNPWDVGSSRIFAALGAKAIASTSAGNAYSKGQIDGTLTLGQMISGAREIGEHTGLPVNADLENGGSDTPDGVRSAILQAIEAGLAGASIEDIDPLGTIYPFEKTLERAQAACDARSGHDLVLTLRTEIMLTDAPDFDAVLKRVKAYAEIGADVIFAPGLSCAKEIAAVVSAAGDTPVNVLVGNNKLGLTRDDLAGLGVARISLGSGVARAAYGAAIDVCKRALETGEFHYPQETASFETLNGLLG
jgi:2-methylisocitrate lyase-like PEP mutase family enzyme